MFNALLYIFPVSKSSSGPILGNVRHAGGFSGFASNLANRKFCAHKKNSAALGIQSFYKIKYCIQPLFGARDINYVYIVAHAKNKWKHPGMNLAFLMPKMHPRL